LAAWRFYTTPAGGEAVKEELRDLGRGPKAALGRAMRGVAEGTNVPRQDEKLSDGLRAVRETYDGREFRMIYVRVAGDLVALHAIEKRSSKIPKRALDLAKRRRSEMPR
jgi:phage-related protein